MSEEIYTASQETKCCHVINISHVGGNFNKVETLLQTGRQTANGRNIFAVMWRETMILC